MQRQVRFFNGGKEEEGKGGEKKEQNRIEKREVWKERKIGSDQVVCN